MGGNDLAFFVSDLHGRIDRYQKLFDSVIAYQPNVLFLGGDLLPHLNRRNPDPFEQVHSFIHDFLLKGFLDLKARLGASYPHVFLILGNDDPRIAEPSIADAENLEIWHYVHFRWVKMMDFGIIGYSFVPPTPFRLKDWERYDVSQTVKAGCLSPAEGFRTVEPEENIEQATIEKHLEMLVSGVNAEKSIFLFHSPPYNTSLDRAALDGVMAGQTPVDIHVGSIAIRRFIEKYQPWITLHGHIHESTRLTGSWKQNIGKTVCYNAAHDGPELSLVVIPLYNPEHAKRILL